MQTGYRYIFLAKKWNWTILLAQITNAQMHLCTLPIFWLSLQIYQQSINVSYHCCIQDETLHVRTWLMQTNETSEIHIKNTRNFVYLQLYLIP